MKFVSLKGGKTRNDRMLGNIKDLQKENINLKESLSFTHKEIAELKGIFNLQEGAIKALQIGVNCLQKDVKMDRERAIRIESHSRRNNFNFFSIPEIANESFAKTEPRSS